jgi:Arc/MetJ-type ribon-helix-helix transcriptional regulator
MTIGCPTSVVRAALQLLLERALAAAEEIQQLRPLPLAQDRGQGLERARGRARGQPRRGLG